jgi:hypothetical protein
MNLALEAPKILNKRQVTSGETPLTTPLKKSNIKKSKIWYN